MKALVTGPWQSTFPYWVEVQDDNGTPIAYDMGGGGMHREKADAQNEADELNRKFQQ